METKNLSEKRFEEFCNLSGIPLSRIARRKSKTPDYKIIVNSTEVLVEVKELGDNEDEARYRKNLDATGYASGTGLGVVLHGDQRVRKQISKAMPQLKQVGPSKSPAVVVLHDSLSMFRIGPLEIRLAMFGQDALDNRFKHRFGKGQKTGKRHNRTLSAVGLLTDEGDALHLQLFPNHFAQTPLPLFSQRHYVSHFKLGPFGDGGLPGWREAFPSDATP